jgi:hypothetical protein
MLFFKTNSLPKFVHPPIIKPDEDMQKRLDAFNATHEFSPYIELDSDGGTMRVYQRETYKGKHDPLVFKWDEFVDYTVWEDGYDRDRRDLGFSITGEILPNGKINGGKDAIPGQRLRRPHVYKRFLTMKFNYGGEEIPVVIDVISIRVQTETKGYRIMTEQLEEFLDYLDELKEINRENKK